MVSTDLLLLVGRRGSTIQALPVVHLSVLTDSIERHNYPGFDWDLNVPYISTAAVAMAEASGTSGNSPLGVEHWSAVGDQPYDVLAAWRGCLLLLERF